MINAATTTNQHLKIILPNTNKALAQILQDASPQTLNTLTQTKDLHTLLEGLLKQTLQEPQQNKLLLELLKNNPTLQTLANATKTIQELLSLLKHTKPKLPLEAKLEEFISHIKDIEPKSLQKKLQNAGPFLESQLKNNTHIKEIANSDIKALLLQAKKELHTAAPTHKQEILQQIDKLLLQIDYHQLLSHLSNATSLYLPYSWDALEEGELFLKKTKNKSYFCDIHLQLKEYGALNIRLGLFEHNQLSIKIDAQNQELCKLLKHNIKTLKKGLVSAEISLKDISFTSQSQQQYSPLTHEDISVGFEVQA